MKYVLSIDLMTDIKDHLNRHRKTSMEKVQHPSMIQILKKLAGDERTS